MRNLLTLAALLLTAGIASAQPRPPADMLAERVAALETRVTALEQRAGPQGFTAQPQVAAFAPSAVVVPPGQHAHRTLDGRTIIHSNSNYGSAAAHAGIAAPWVRVAEAGQVVSTDQAFQGDAGCPNGNCPAAGQSARGFFRSGGFFRRGR